MWSPLIWGLAVLRRHADWLLNYIVLCQKKVLYYFLGASQVLQNGYVSVCIAILRIRVLFCLCSCFTLLFRCLFSLLYVFLLKIHYCSKQIGPLNWHCNATAELGVVALQDGHEVVAAVDGQEAVDEVEAVVVRLPLQILMQTWRSTMQRQCKSTKSLCLGALCVSSTWLILLQICIFT